MSSPSEGSPAPTRHPHPLEGPRQHIFSGSELVPGHGVLTAGGPKVASWPVCFSYPVGYTGIVWPLASLAGRARQRASPRPGQPVSLNLPESSASLLVETSPPPPPGSVLQSSLLAGVVCAFTRPCRHSSRASKCGMLAPALTAQVLMAF